MDYIERHTRLFNSLVSGVATKKSIEDFYVYDNDGFVAYIDRYIEEHGLKRSYILQRALLSPQYGYKIMNGQKHTNDRNIIIRLCVSMKMNVEETQKALTYYGMAILDQNKCRDDIIMLGIEKGQGIEIIQSWLELVKEAPLI